MAVEGRGTGMSDLIEGVGTAVQGGLFSRALEPHSGAKSPHPHQPESCLNCGEKLTGAYCHSCGQIGHVHRTLGAFGHDLLHGALHLEGKLWRTLPMLMFKPGNLTRRYIEGERARFVSPMALFLFGVFLMFAVFQMVGLTAPTDIPGEETAADTLQAARNGAEEEAANLREQLAEEGLTADEQADLELRLITLERFLAQDPNEALTNLTRDIRQGVEPQDAEAPTVAQGVANDFVDGFEAGNNRAAQEAADGALDDVAGSDVEPIVRADLSDLTGGSSGLGWVDEAAHKWRSNPSLMLYKLQSNAYKFSWLLIPISIPFVWLLFFWKRRFRGYDHAIFVTYSLSFMTLLFIAASILFKLGVPAVAVGTVVMIIPPIHLYKQLRGAYQLRRFSAFWRLLALSWFIWIIVGIFGWLLFVLGAF